MNRKETIRSAYRLTGSNSFYDGTITSPGPRAGYSLPEGFRVPPCLPQADESKSEKWERCSDPI